LPASSLVAHACPSSIVKDLHPGKLTPEQLEEIKELLYKVCIPSINQSPTLICLLYQHNALLFPNVVVTPEEQYALTKVFYISYLSDINV
jgi:hypothetical protein